MILARRQPLETVPGAIRARVERLGARLLV